MKDINYNFIKVIISVMEQGSMAKAAEELGMLPGSVSYAIGKLREHFGDPLFIRDKKGVKPTALARVIYVQLKDTEANIRYAFSYSLKAEEHSRLTLYATQLVELYLMKNLLEQDFFTDGKQITFDSRPRTLEVRTMRLRDRDIDLDIGLPLMKDPSVIRVKLKSPDYVYISRLSNDVDFNALNFEGTKFNRTLGNINANWMNVDSIRSQIFRTNLDESADGNNEVFYRTESLMNIIVLLACSDVTYIVPAFMANFLSEIFPIKQVPIPVMNANLVGLYAHYHVTNKHNPNIKKILNIFGG